MNLSERAHSITGFIIAGSGIGTYQAAVYDWQPPFFQYKPGNFAMAARRLAKIYNSGMSGRHGATIAVIGQS